ncbi:hypothetical protein HOO54_19820 [Bacillus sp. WMMC1349]|uniref:YwpF-like family protein n=1 Tax=Bacillus sp. WMMC1349 TaxID=2736254 RepID=UPI001556D9BD|nr:YwpF-like family protein [Bacillus sp. WMMC1349]NPC94408.1 hypothetical protein [Bacillus sp. WMMC1349]
MKTFRLIDLKIVRQDETAKQIEEFPLIDGLIINKEDGENHWMIEGLVSKKYRYFFEYLLQEKKEVKVYVTITKKSNLPALLLAKVKKITILGEHVSVLLDGKMITSKLRQGSEKVLEGLMKEGFTGDKLLEAFKQHI